MGYERYNRGQRDPRDNSADSRDTYSSARDYEATGYYDRGQGRGQERGQERGWDNRQTDYYGREQRWNQQSDQRDYERQDRYASYGDYGYRQSEPYQGSYGSDRHRFNDVEDDSRRYRRDYGQRQYGQRDYGQRDYGQRDNDRLEYGRGGYGRQPQGYDYQERGFLNRAGDEVRSWFGDEDAERRREADARFDQRYDNDRDSDYGSWRRGQIAALDRDYDEYRNENRTKFQSEFANWRTERQGQRNSLTNVAEHMEVVGSDGTHVGTVDKVRGDRILLTKNDQDAGGRHHSIPSRWIETVDDKVTLRKTAEQAQSEWRDEERNQAFFGDDRDDGAAGGRYLNRSFSGTY